MGTFSDSNLAKKLSDLNNSQQSIQTLSLWLIHHRKHCSTIVDVWLRELKKAHPKRKLTFLYLANDVIQNSKKKGPEFNKAFRSVLIEAFKSAVKDVDEKAKGSMERLVKIWEERSVFDKDFSNHLKKTFSKQSQTVDTENDVPEQKEEVPVKTGTKRPGKSEKELSKKKKKELSLLEEIEQEMANDSESRSPPEADELLKVLSDLENSASSDAVVREQIAALPAEVSDVSLLDNLKDKGQAGKLVKQVEEACELLTDYNSRLHSELEERKRVARMLRGYVLLQKQRQGEAEQRLQEYKSKLQEVSSVRKELKSHVQSLPDLNLLPDVTGLAPLPSAGDLFNTDKEANELF